uniref:AA_permease domain-containing protein n=1 Tax=Macrostomum lignano TaxID=282301 RepID=A0A1I8FCV9_9PLAT
MVSGGSSGGVAAACCRKMVASRRCRPMVVRATRALGVWAANGAGGARADFISGPLIGMPERSAVSQIRRRRPVMVVATAVSVQKNGQWKNGTSNIDENGNGLSSGVMGGMILLGNISGAALGLFINNLGVLGLYGVVICILIPCIAITVFSVEEPPTKDTHPPINTTRTSMGFYYSFPDAQGLSTVVGFLEYWLGDMVNLPNCWNAAKGVSMLLIPLLCNCRAIVSPPGDRRLRPDGFSAAFLAGLRGQHAFYIATALSVIFGLSFGGYQAVDFALLMDVLPDENDKSRDIAVWQQALVLRKPWQCQWAASYWTYFERVNCKIGLGYIILFSVTAVYFVLSGLFVMRIQRAK